MSSNILWTDAAMPHPNDLQPRPLPHTWPTTTTIATPNDLQPRPLPHPMTYNHDHCHTQWPTTTTIATPNDSQTRLFADPMTYNHNYFQILWPYAKTFSDRWPQRVRRLVAVRCWPHERGVHLQASPSPECLPADQAAAEAVCQALLDPLGSFQARAWHAAKLLAAWDGQASILECTLQSEQSIVTSFSWLQLRHYLN